MNKQKTHTSLAFLVKRQPLFRCAIQDPVIFQRHLGVSFMRTPKKIYYSGQ